MILGTVLVVEDEAIVRDSMVRVLQRAGLDARGVASGEEALALMANTRYDILLADIRMPGIDGPELLEQARSIDPEVGAMLITGYGTLGNAIAAVDQGVLGFILKPVAPEDLVKTVKRGLGRIRGQREFHRMSVLRPLLGLLSHLHSAMEIDQSLQESARVVGEECGAGHVSIHLLDGAGALRQAASWGSQSGMQEAAIGQVEPLRERALHRGETFLVGEGGILDRAAGTGKGRQDFGTASAMYHPIRAIRGRAVGVMALLKGTDGPSIGEEDQAFVSLVCSLLTPLVEGCQ